MVGPIVLIGSVVAALTILPELVLATLVALFAAGVALVITWYGFAFLADAHDGRVAFVTSLLSTRMVSGKSTTYYADCGPVSKMISSRAYGGLPRGVTCHLYYAPGSRSLLSIEPASANEPKPEHPFGPDSAHVWDRLRWSWVAVTVGVLGLALAAHAVAVAHPAHPVRVGGTVSDYYLSRGKVTSRSLWLAGDGNPYVPQSEGAYEPPLDSFSNLIGKEVVLYVDQGTRNVLAINDGDTLHAADWYLHPENEKSFQVINGLIVGGASLFVFGVGVAGILFARWRAVNPAAPAAPGPASDPLFAHTPMYSGSPLYAPPEVRAPQANWAPALVLVGVLVAVLGFAAALTITR